MFKIIDKNNCLIKIDGNTYIYNVPSVSIYKCTDKTVLIEEQIKNLPGTLSKKNISEIIRYNREKKVSLDSITLILTDRCNLRCKYCFENSRMHQHGEMTIETAEEAVGILLGIARRDHKRKYINFFGGEPLLRFDLIESIANKITEAAKTDQIDTVMSITTNATLLNDRIFELIDRADISLLISIDGDKKMHDSNRVFPDSSGSYDCLIDKLQRYLPKRPDLFKARATINPGYMNFIALTEHLENIGFQAVYFSIEDCFSKNRNRAEIEIILDQYDLEFGKYIEYLHKKIKSGNTDILFHYVDVVSSLWNRSLHFIPCHIGNGHATVSPDGSLYPCQKLYGSENTEVFPLHRLRDSERIFEIRTVHEKQLCPDCWARYLCSGGCPALSIARDGNDLIPDTWRCSIKQTEIKWLIWLFIKLSTDGTDLSVLSRK